MEEEGLRLSLTWMWWQRRRWPATAAQVRPPSPSSSSSSIFSFLFFLLLLLLSSSPFPSTLYDFFFFESVERLFHLYKRIRNDFFFFFPIKRFRTEGDSTHSLPSLKSTRDSAIFQSMIIHHFLNHGKISF